MEEKNKCVRAGCSRFLWPVLAVFLCAAPCIGAEVIDGPVSGPYYVFGMVDILPGADITGGLYITPDSIVEIHGGNVDNEGITLLYDGTDPVVTVYGTNFSVDGVPLDPSATEFTVDPYDGGVLTGTYENSDPINILFHSNIPIYLEAPGVTVAIDIKPGSYPNAINLGSNGVIPVAILSSDTFDATTVDPETVFLAGAGVAVRGKGNNKYLAGQEDVNGDGLTDLVVKIETEILDSGTFQNGTAILTGETSDGVKFTGSDSIRIVPPE